MWQDFLAFLHSPPTWAALLILLAGVLLINYLRDVFAVVVALALGAFIWFALATFVASFAIGWPVMIFWFGLGVVLLYNTGWHVDKERYFLLSLNLLVLLVLLTFVGTQAFRLSVWMSFAAALIGIVVYLIMGLGVARVKWGFWNKKLLDQSLNGKAKFLSRLKGEYAGRFQDLKAYEEWEARKSDGTQQSGYGGHRSREPDKPKYDKATLEAINALSGDHRTLQKTPVPEALKPLYAEYVGENLRVPNAFESKQKFFWWLAAWPGVFVHMIFAEVIERLWKWFFEVIENHLNNAQRKIFKGNEEFLKP